MEGYMSEVRLFAGNFTPLYWNLCNGELMSIAQNTALFSLIGTTYGGDGQVTFALPDLRGRRAVHSGNMAGPGLPQVYIGEVSGTENITILNSQMPMHLHTMSAQMTGSVNLKFFDDTGIAGSTPQNNYYAAASQPVYAPSPDTTLAPATITTNLSTMSLAASGGSQPVSLITPYLALNYIICVEGIYPSRN